MSMELQYGHTVGYSELSALTGAKPCLSNRVLLPCKRRLQSAHLSRLLAVVHLSPTPALISPGYYTKGYTLTYKMLFRGFISLDAPNPGSVELASMHEDKADLSGMHRFAAHPRDRRSLSVIALSGLPGGQFPRVVAMGCL